MTSTHTARSLVTEARDRAGFHEAPTGPLVISGQSPLAPLLARSCARVLKVEVLRDESPEAVAAFANANAAAFVISLQTSSTSTAYTSTTGELPFALTTRRATRESDRLGFHARGRPTAG